MYKLVGVVGIPTGGYSVEHVQASSGNTCMYVLDKGYSLEHVQASGSTCPVMSHFMSTQAKGNATLDALHHQYTQCYRGSGLAETNNQPPSSLPVQ